jgi:TolB-like protein/tetratricopeptide (TPR) repeat protein
MPEDGILRSWKEIARYLKCDRKTCARWEAECGLPVRRIDAESRRSPVFAYRSELDEWLAKKRIVSLTEAERPGFRRFMLPAAAALLVLTPVLILMKTRIFSTTSRTPAIAVLAAVDPGSSEQDFFLGEGFRAEIQRRLSSSGLIRITPLPSESSEDPRSQIVLGPTDLPDYLLEGALKRENGRSRLTVSLQRLKNKKVVWTKDYDQPVEGLTACLSDVCRRVFETLKISASIGSAAADEPSGPDTLELYLTGYFLLSRISGERQDPWTLYHQASYYSRLDNKESNELALRLFNRVVNKYPRFAPALLGLAQCYVNFLNLGIDMDLRWLDKAEGLIRQAEALNPKLPEYFKLRIEALLIRDLIQGTDSVKTYFALAQRGLAQFPNDGPLNSMAGYCWFLKFGREGREADLDRALLYKERGFLSNPSSPFNVNYAELLMLRREFDKALRVCDIIQRTPDPLLVEFRRAEILFYQGELARSEAVIRRFANQDNEVDALLLMGMIAARRNDVAAVRRIVAEIERLGSALSNPIHENAVWFASMFAGIGETAKAEEILRKFIKDKRTDAMRFIHKRYLDINPNFEQMKSRDLIFSKGE